MAYQRQNFQDGQVLYAAQMNHIEDGIVANEGAIPTKTSQLDNDKGYLTIDTLPKYNGGVV